MSTSMNKRVEKFNQQFPVGSTVRWRPTYPAAEFQEYEVRHEAYDMHGQAVAFLKGKAGCVSVEPQFIDYDFQPLPEGKSPDHEHNDDWISIQMFNGDMYSGPPEEFEDLAMKAQMWSKCCSICGSSAFGRDVYYGME